MAACTGWGGGGGGREGIPVELEQLSVPRPPIIIDLYSQDEELARQLVELGYRGSGEVRGLVTHQCLCVYCIRLIFTDFICTCRPNGGS